MMTNSQVVLLDIGDEVVCMLHDIKIHVTVENICGVDIQGRLNVYVAVTPVGRNRWTWLKENTIQLRKCNEIFDERNGIWIRPENIIEVVSDSIN